MKKLAKKVIWVFEDMAFHRFDIFLGFGRNIFKRKEEKMGDSQPYGRVALDVATVPYGS